MYKASWNSLAAIMSALIVAFLNYQPAKFAAIEARSTTQQPASEVLIAIVAAGQAARGPSATRQIADATGH